MFTKSVFQTSTGLANVEFVTSPAFDDIDHVVAGTREFVANGYRTVYKC